MNTHKAYQILPPSGVVVSKSNNPDLRAIIELVEADGENCPHVEANGGYDLQNLLTYFSLAYTRHEDRLSEEFRALKFYAKVLFEKASAVCDSVQLPRERIVITARNVGDLMCKDTLNIFTIHDIYVKSPEKNLMARRFSLDAEMVFCRNFFSEVPVKVQELFVDNHCRVHGELKSGFVSSKQFEAFNNLHIDMLCSNQILVAGYNEAFLGDVSLAGGNFSNFSRASSIQSIFIKNTSESNTSSLSGSFMIEGNLTIISGDLVINGSLVADDVVDIGATARIDVQGYLFADVISCQKISGNRICADKVICDEIQIAPDTCEIGKIEIRGQHDSLMEPTY